MKIFISCIFIVLLVSGCANSSKKFGGKAQAHNNKMDVPSTLSPVFYKNAQCEDIDSDFASRTRYDGSTRPSNRNGGKHGGTDWTINIGQPLLAIASGEVIHKGEGGMMEGKYIWLLHSPKDTGMPYWIYSKYQHLDKIPSIKIGTKVKVGDVIALGGDTGTKGGHYGHHGYPHLHLNIKKTKSPDYKITGSKIKPGKHINTDFLYLFEKTRHMPKAFIENPVKDTEVQISYMKDGKIIPEDAKIIWPIECH